MTDTPVLTRSAFPEYFRDTEHLEDFLSLPTPETLADLDALEGDMMVLGVAGKMGVTLARLVKRAAPHKRVIGVARFSEPGVRERLEGWGVETIVCDLLDRDAVHALPKVPNLVYMAGLKFDTGGKEDLLWAMNVLVPSYVAEAFKNSRIVTLSSTLVYPYCNPIDGGAVESLPVAAQAGEYANSVVGRERIFQHFSRIHETPGRLVRFVYGIDMRYGVLQEIARWVLDGVEIPVATSTVNLMWQGDAINHFVRLLRHCEVPAAPINIGNPELTSVRRVANQFGAIYGIEPRFVGEEQPECAIVNCDAAGALLGNPTVTVNTMIEWVAEWTKAQKPLHGKPTKFQIRSGAF